MRTPVKCNNCECKWLRVVVSGTSTEPMEDIQYNCPNCNSNWYDILKPESERKAKERGRE